jgi:hypothetical protein
MKFILGFKFILQARAKKENDDSIRYLNPLDNPLNFNAKSIENLLFWKKANICEHPLTMNIPTKEIEGFSKEKNPPTLRYDFPVHSQGTERHIPLITETASKVCDEQREGLILSILKSRKLNPEFNSKCDYNV